MGYTWHDQLSGGIVRTERLSERPFKINAASEKVAIGSL
jgi:hypothetical protein